MNNRTNSLLLAITFVVVAVCVVLLLTDVGVDGELDPATELDETAKDRLASEAAIRQIAAESRILDDRAAGSDPDRHIPLGPDTDRHVPLAVDAVAPPGFQPAPVAEHDPTPPEGYSFSSYREVTQLPLTDDDRADIRKTTPTPDWMDLGLEALADQAAVHDRDWTFGWVKLAADAGFDALAGILAAQGGEAIGQAGDLVRARMPADPTRLRAIASADAVAGIGTVPASEKIAETLAQRALADASDAVPVWVTLMDEDPDGVWRRELQGLGAVVGRFDPALRTYAASIPLASLAPLSNADYVLAVESIGRLEPTLDIATTVMGADSTRTYDADRHMFTGTAGASVPIGVIDTGLNVDHVDISSNRRSICGANFVPRSDRREEDQDLWLDYDGHGTAVTGIVAGSGSSKPVNAGMAPLVQDIRFAKALGSTGRASALGWVRALDWLATPTSCGGDIPRKPLVLNSSLGVSSEIWEARSYMERKIDASVWSARQLFVTSAGNGSDVVFSSMAGAKNALGVGAVQNVGDIAGYSSVGPTYDGRLTPNVVGTFDILAAAGRGSQDGMVQFGGTSAASPSVVGVAALVMDAVPELKEEPAALRARLMASAIKPDGFLDAPAAFPLDNSHGPGTLQNVYGLGKVSPRTAVLNRDTEDGWFGGSTAFEVDPDKHLAHDIVVPPGASRLEVVLTWDEPPADTITNSVLHDLDLWVDRGASCGAIAACGRSSSRSSVDNVEWVIVPNPRPGVYRLKVTPNRVYGTPPKAGLAWQVIRGASTPSLSVSANVDRIDVAPDEDFEVEVTMSTDGYVAAGANLRVDCRSAPGSSACDELSFDGEDSTAEREDGLERDLERHVPSVPTGVLKVEVGEIGPDEEQVVTLRFSGQPAGIFQLYLAASGWNAISGATSVAVVVGDPDADAPAPIERPPNDDFDSAVTLAHEGGETTFDLIAATPDQGEPSFPLPGDSHPTRQRSMWYLWTAPDDGLARFTIAKAAADDYADLAIVQVFEDGPLAALEGIGTAQQGGGTAFFAERDETYRIRLTVHDAHLAIPGVDAEGEPVLRRPSMPRLTLKWGPATAPANDHYAHASMIEGETGTLVGNNQGATTEPGEFMGNAHAFTPVSLASWGASVWHRWTAPSSGDWKFSVDRHGLALSVFVGESVEDARLVSGAPRTTSPDQALFPATAGAEYYIAVASASAYFSGTEFTLSWEPGERQQPGNDDFAAAVALDADGSVDAPWLFPAMVPVYLTSLDFDTLTVEHGEPAGSGVRTAWYTWQPQAGGRHTWNVGLQPGVGGPLGGATLQLSVFRGTELAALEPVAMDVGEDTEMRMAFDAEADTSYAFALGLPRDSAQASLLPAHLFMELGETPANDDLANAMVLMEMSGSVSGSNQFATNEPGEFTGALGDSSVWFAIEPAQDGWIRFAVEGLPGLKLAIYTMGTHGNLELVGTSRSLVQGQASVSVNADAGVRYVIRLGSYLFDANGFAGGRERGEFVLSWAPGEPPAQLAFVQVVEDGDTDDEGAEIALDGLGSQAFNADGTELYVASALGIVVFQRDTATGELTPMRTLEDFPIDDPTTQLLWDEAGAALLVASCDGWMRFTAAQGGGIEPAGEVAGGPCPTEALLIDGSFVHNVMANVMIETYRFDDERTTLESVEQVMIDGVSKAAMTADGSHVYAIAGGFLDSSLLTFERDADTGSLTMISTVMEGDAIGGDGTVVEGLVDTLGLAVHSSHLFVASGSAGGNTAVFDLDDPGNPAFVGKIDSFTGFLSFFSDCGFSAARHDAAAVDTACSSSSYAYTVQADADSVFPSDYLRLFGFGNDAYGNELPDNDDVFSLIESPDGRHLYISGYSAYLQFFPVFAFGEHYQVVVFERRSG